MVLSKINIISVKIESNDFLKTFWAKLDFIVSTCLTFFHTHVEQRQNATIILLFDSSLVLLINTNLFSLNSSPSPISVHISFSLPRGSKSFYNSSLSPAYKNLFKKAKEERSRISKLGEERDPVLFCSGV